VSVPKPPPLPAVHLPAAPQLPSLPNPNTLVPQLPKPPSLPLVGKPNSTG